MFTKLFERSDFVQTVELWPPGFSFAGPPQPPERRFSWLEERLEILGEYFDGFHVADLKVPGWRYLDSVMTAVRLKERLRWLDIAPTIATRDRNRKAMEEAVATALFFGVENLILVRGDPFPEGEAGGSKNVYDVARLSDAVKLARKVQEKVSQAELSILTPIDVARAREPSYLEMIRGREKATSDIFLAQIFGGGPDEYLELIDRIRGEGIRSPILQNVFPFYSSEDAVRVSRRFGFGVGSDLLAELKDGGVTAGVRAAGRFRDALYSNRGKVNGVFVSSRGEPELAIRLVR